MFCKNCGREIEDNSNFCQHCGAKQKTDGVFEGFSEPNGYSDSHRPTPAHVPAQPDAPSMGFAVLGFFLPIVGLILYLCMFNSAPLRAKSAGKGAVAGFVVGMILSILFIVLCVLFAFYGDPFYQPGGTWTALRWIG